MENAPDFDIDQAEENGFRWDKNYGRANGAVSVRLIRQLS
jgi:hypothetical protein